MNIKQELEWLLKLTEEISGHYAELAGELPQLRIVVDNVRGNSELKKIPGIA